jgi:hypothetical protein
MNTPAPTRDEVLFNAEKDCWFATPLKPVGWEGIAAPAL